MSKEDRIRDLAKMFNVMDPDHREKLLKEVAAKDPQLVKSILDQLFVFEDLAHINPKHLQVILQKVQAGQLALALRNASPELLAQVMSALSKRTGQELSDQMDAMGPQKLSLVQGAQEHILALAKELESQGKVLLKRDPGV